jgi:hypothetical protein
MKSESERADPKEKEAPAERRSQRGARAKSGGATLVAPAPPRRRRRHRQHSLVLSRLALPPIAPRSMKRIVNGGCYC